MKVSFKRRSPPRLAVGNRRSKVDAAQEEISKAKPKEKSSFREKLATFASVASFGLNVLAVGGGTAVVAMEHVATEEAQCSLVIADYFAPTADGDTPHGVSVRRAAETVGTPRHIVDLQLDNTYGSRTGRSRTSMGVVFGDESSSRRELRRSMDDFIAEKYSAFLDTRGDVLERRSVSRMTNSVVNFSQAYDRSMVSRDIYKSFRPAWESDNEEFRELRVQKVENAARLFRLDADELLSEDPAVNGPERQKLQQAIIDRVDHVLGRDSRVESALEDFEETVADFESRNNSVVIAGGNSGRVEEWLVRDNGGHGLIVPENFEKNFIEIDDVTSVGAVRLVKASGREELVELPATYGSDSEGLDIWAYGTYEHPGADPINGTSFAAPRTSSPMTQLHCDNPEMSSDEIEALLMKDYGRGMEPVAQHEVVLDLELARGLLAD